jgi:acyl-[acyl-carrier-protein]-phospholipid O-acyltransferase/long-chain-fatty-acid--[acyl-carrier-protein] ligase
LAPGKEWIIGGLLFGLAILGAVASFMIEPIPAAAPDRPLTWKLWQPLQANVGILLKSRPLALAVLGIAFFTFMTLFLRQSLIYEGEIGKELHSAQKLLAKSEGIRTNGGSAADELNLLDTTATADQKAELRIALLIAMIGLGVGIGSSLAGWLSGKKVELGLVPIGCVFLIIFNTVLAFSLGTMWALIPTLILIGVAAGLYIVPLYTLLQHRAPKESKGGLVATSNFVNVAGGLIAIVVFFLITMVLERVMGTTLSLQQVRANPSLIRDYIAELERQIKLPMVLCLVASVMTAGMLILLCKQLPDFLVRTLLWLRSQGKYHLHVSGIQHVPSSGPAILATNCAHFDDSLHIVASTDRYVRFFLFEEARDGDSRALDRYVARQTGLVTLPPEGCTPAQWQSAIQEAVQTLQVGDIVGLTTASQRARQSAAQFLAELQSKTNAVVLPVHCSIADHESHDADHSSAGRRVEVSIGAPMKRGASAQETVAAILALA